MIKECQTLRVENSFKFIDWQNHNFLNYKISINSIFSEENHKKWYEKHWDKYLEVVYFISKNINYRLSDISLTGIKEYWVKKAIEFGYKTMTGREHRNEISRSNIHRY